MTEAHSDERRGALDERLRVGLIVPSTNTVAEPEYHEMAPWGVTVQTGRLRITDPQTGSDAAFLRLMEQVRGSMEETIEALITCRPDHLALGMTAVAFLGGREGEERLRTAMEERSGLPVTTGPSAMAQALGVYGVSRIAVISPYQPYAEGEVESFFASAGHKVVRMVSLRSENATSIAEVPGTRLWRIIHEIDSAGVEAIVQVGTNLAMARLADEAERSLGKPVLAINTATLWYVLRHSGVNDRFEGFGSLFREH